MLSFSYRVRNAGWANALLVDGNVEASMRVSYLSDALTDLTEAMIQILQGYEQTSFAWFDEPGEYRWDLHRVGELLEIRIGHSRFNDRSINGVVLTFSCTLAHFSQEVIRALQRIYDELGIVGYERRWRGYTFPLDGYMRLKELARAENLGSLLSGEDG